MPPNFKRDQQTHVRIEEFEAYAEAYIILSLIPHPPAGCYAGLPPRKPHFYSIHIAYTTSCVKLVLRNPSRKG